MEDKEYTGYSVSVYNQHTEDSAEGGAENSQAKGPDTGRYSGEHSTEEAKSFIGVMSIECNRFNVCVYLVPCLTIYA